MRTSNKATSAPIDKKTMALMAKDYENDCLVQLRVCGYRITMPRVQVIQALGDAQFALSPYEIHQKILKKGGRIDVVSVYRILATLQEIGVVHHIGSADGYFPSRNPNANRQDCAHIVMSDTRAVVEMPMTEAIRGSLIAEAQKLGYNPTAVKVELVGQAGTTKKK